MPPFSPGLVKWGTGECFWERSDKGKKNIVVLSRKEERSKGATEEFLFLETKLSM